MIAECKKCKKPTEFEREEIVIDTLAKTGNYAGSYVCTICGSEILLYFLENKYDQKRK